MRYDHGHPIVADVHPLGRDLVDDAVVGQKPPFLEGVERLCKCVIVEVRQRVRVLRPLAVGGEVRVPAGSHGEILNLEKSATEGVVYQTHFDCLAGIPLRVPEAALGEWRRPDDA